MLTRVLYHDHCFDGAASAAYFSRFIAGAVHPDGEFRYTGMAHKASQLFEPARFGGGGNAIVAIEYRHRGLQILQRPKADLVVRPSPERVPQHRRPGAFPPGYQRAEAL